MVLRRSEDSCRPPGRGSCWADNAVTRHSAGHLQAAGEPAAPQWGPWGGAEAARVSSTSRTQLGVTSGLQSTASVQGASGERPRPPGPGLRGQGLGQPLSWPRTCGLRRPELGPAGGLPGEPVAGGVSWPPGRGDPERSCLWGAHRVWSWRCLGRRCSGDLDVPPEVTAVGCTWDQRRVAGVMGRASGGKSVVWLAPCRLPLWSRGGGRREQSWGRGEPRGAAGAAPPSAQGPGALSPPLGPARPP